MKAFEKYWGKQEEIFAKEPLVVHHPPKAIAYDAWKAALKWMLETRPMNHFGIAKANCVQVDDIEKELGR